MPFQSSKQRKFLYAKKPKIAKEFAKKTPKDKKLPKRKRKDESFPLWELYGLD